MMDRLLIVVDASANIEPFRNELIAIFELQFVSLDQIRHTLPEQNLFFDINMHNAGYLLEIKEWLSQGPKGGKVVFAVDKRARIQNIQARALGATDICYRPITGKALLKCLLGDFDSLLTDASEPEIENMPGAGAAIDALENIFASARFGAPLDFQKIDSATEAIAEQIKTHGVGLWIDTVRQHHSRTYQHSLIVTGVLEAFNQYLGFSSADRKRMAFGGMLHDIGKARIPLSLLEKPGALNNDEEKVMRRHPEYGYDALATMSGIHNDTLEMVVHHHEYLDGSGYPHRLASNKISDPVRLMTIADIFGALVERRAYKESMSNEAAYEIMRNMGSKLDRHLMREFQFISKLKVAEYTA